MAAFARDGDPIGSHLTVASICADTALADLIVWACGYHNEAHAPVTDDDVLALVETRTGRRFQRNVLARARGRLERDGVLERCPSVVGRTGRPTVAFRLPSHPGQLRLALA